MFTLKLYNPSKTRLIEAESCTVYRFSPSFIQITTHQKNQGTDRCWWLGTSELLEVPQDECFDFAIIENANGRTTERVMPALPEKVPVRRPAELVGAAVLE